jgi:hypothetical protein
MPLRFTIRDVLWLTLVVALIVGWWVDHRHTQNRHASEVYVKWTDPSQDAQILREIYRDRRDVQFVADADSVTIVTASPALREQIERLLAEVDQPAQ